MRVARTKQGAMRVALTMVVAVLAVLAEPVLGETRLLTRKAVTTSIRNLDGSAIVDGEIAPDSTSVAIMNGNNGAANPWVQIDLGASATIQTIDVYGDRSSPQCNIAFIVADPVRANANQDCAFPDIYPNVARVDPATGLIWPGSGAIIAVGDTPCTPGAECILGIDPADSTKTMGTVATVCAHLTKPTEVGFDEVGVINPEGKFSVDW